MQCSLMTLATFLGAVMAQTWGFDTITAPTRDEDLTVGSSYTIQWTPDATYDAETVTIQLLAGTSNTTLEISNTAVASSVKSSAGQYVWSIPTSLEQANTYGFKLYLDSDASIFQYSNPFNINFVASSSTTTSAAPVTTLVAPVTTSAAPVTTSAASVITSAASESIESVSTTAPLTTTTAFFANTTTTNTDLPEPASGTVSVAISKTTLATTKGTGSASVTGSSIGNSTVTAGAASVAAPLALLAGAIALAF